MAKDGFIVKRADDFGCLVGMGRRVAVHPPLLKGGPGLRVMVARLSHAANPKGRAVSDVEGSGSYAGAVWSFPAFCGQRAGRSG